MSSCPYCQSEHFTQDWVPSEGDDGYNKCKDCSKWSLYDSSLDELKEIENPNEWPQSQSQQTTPE